nr:hypothetical protein [Actinomadura atramentaria]
MDAGEIALVDPDLAAFQIDAVLVAANTALRLDGTAIGKVRRVVEIFLCLPDAPPRQETSPRTPAPGDPHGRRSPGSRPSRPGGRVRPGA